MAENPRALFRRLSPASGAGGAVFVIGCILAATLHGGFLLLAALGALGPTLLRQAGVLDDQDEFQKQAAAAASTHAFVASVVVATAVLVARAWQGPLGRDPDAAPWLILFGVVLATRFAADAWRFWDARRAAPRILLVFGTLWPGVRGSLPAPPPCAHRSRAAGGPARARRGVLTLRPWVGAAARASP